jgi:hypothetical protein
VKGGGDLLLVIGYQETEMIWGLRVFRSRRRDGGSCGKGVDEIGMDSVM